MKNISELVEYVLLPHNDDIVKPRALKTFIDGLAELEINKRLIQNKRILAELLEKEQAYHDKDSEAGDKEMVSESSDNEDDTETASEISDQECFTHKHFVVVVILVYSFQICVYYFFVFANNKQESFLRKRVVQNIFIVAC